MKNETKEIMIQKIEKKISHRRRTSCEPPLSMRSAFYCLRGFSRMADDYIMDPDDFVREHIVVINGKRRHIVTYANSKKGIALRQLHYWFKFFLSFIYEPADNSFAYRNGLNVKLCLNEHLENSTFLKTDIHSYFDSVQYESLYEKLVMHDGEKANRRRLLRTVLSACFYKGKLPIGFVTSPILSDIYLHEFDNDMMNDKNITYTRYADDIIVSIPDSVPVDYLKTVKHNIIQQITPLGLEINAKKTYIRQLKHTGDAIHLLGLNIVKTDAPINRITVSDKYIRETCKDLCALVYGHNSMKPAHAVKQFYKVCGRVQYIIASSKDSENKLNKLIKVKTGTDMDLSPKKFRAICLEGEAKDRDEMERTPEAHHAKLFEQKYLKLFLSKYGVPPESDYDIHLSELALPVRIYNLLRKDGYEWYSQVKGLTEKDILKYRYVGPITYREFREAIEQTAEAYEIMLRIDIPLEEKLHRVIDVRFHKDTDEITNIKKLKNIIRIEVMRIVYLHEVPVLHMGI